jgi:hypothetical protein
MVRRLEVGPNFPDFAIKRGAGAVPLARGGMVMTDLTPRQILDAIQRGMEETWRKIDRGEIRGDGRLDWPCSLESGEKIAVIEKTPAINDMTIREILDAMSRALDRVAQRFAAQKADQSTSPRRPIE